MSVNREKCDAGKDSIRGKNIKGVESLPIVSWSGSDEGMRFERLV